MRNWLKNEYVVLTGASGGIGKELCKILIRDYNANVIGIARNQDKMRSLQNELGINDSRFSYYLFDVGDKKEWGKFASDLESKKINPILLINNAGAFPKFQKTAKTSVETTERIMQTNYFSVVYAVDALLPILQGAEKDKPAIVNVASSAALCTVVGTATYSASKSALKAYTEALQMEEKSNFYIGVMYPGTTATDLFREDANTQNSALDIIAMSAKKMARKIARNIIKKKKRAVIGWDAKLMNWTAKIAPVKGLFLIRAVMKRSKSKVFKEVF